MLFFMIWNLVKFLGIVLIVDVFIFIGSKFICLSFKWGKVDGK